ncbi:leucine-rich repeat and guanylate kinase domain-containing protein [Elephas maximus indicus]|uniref:leucine-rich repeat and guanylate kinase domain-containing protein n=1 Tax=Elephas maximus indicus TaxID=99487 RepID=UPI00211615CF|nr:leucine-rich repeat and guanylate kinase domain-containing protein [Elephas maximus indicus]
MAAPGSGPQGGRSTSPPEAQSISLHSENERQCFSTTFPMGQRPKNAFHKTSSYLLRQLIHRYRRLDAEEVEDEIEDEDEDVVGDGDGDEDEDEDQKQAEVESEESSESEMLNLEEEFDGVLREEMVAEALCKLGRSGCGTGQVYLNLTLSGCDLIDISILCGYVHLQKLDLSVNKIEDLCCVSCMPYLLELNASQNKLTTFFNFKPPKNLKKVDFSCNQISEMSDLSAYQALTKLILDSNEIEEIKGLELCSNLTHLSLANNKITTINGLSMLPIKILCLSNNQIEKITGLEDLKALQNLDLSNNQISSLQGLENHDLLEVLNLEDNKIAELREIEYIKDLPLLRVLSLLRNPIQEKSDYWLFIIFMLLRLTELDHKKIKVEEKVSAVNKYDPPPEVIAAQDHLTHVVNSMMQPQRIFDSTLPSLDAPYPMLILAGPQACGKRELAHRLCRQFNAYFRYGACHTTRPPYFGEGDRVDYHFISGEVYDEMLSMGKFILTYNYGNHSYGLNRDTVEGIARDGLASCIHMEIEGVRSLKCSYFEPRYILVVPMNKTKYEGHLRRKGLFSRAEIECAISRVDLYINMNEKFPGYFDAVINADDLDAAYQRLSQLIREYLGLTEEPAKGLAPTTVLKSKDVTLKTKVSLTQAMVFSITSYARESWTVNKEDQRRIDAFELWCWQRMLNIVRTAKRTNKCVLGEVQPERSLEAKMARLHLTYFGHVIRRPQSLEKDIMLEIYTSPLKSEERPRKISTLNPSDFLDSTDRNYLVKLCANLSAKITPAERDSVQRQHEIARQALMGRAPPDHTLLFQRGLVPAPVISDLRYFTQLGEPQRGFEFYDDYVVTPFGSHSRQSGKDSYDASTCSGLTQPHPWSRERLYPSEVSISSRPGSGKSDGQGDRALKGFTALPKGSISHERDSFQCRKPTVPVVCHPGANTKPILPPIPQGRK